MSILRPNHPLPNAWYRLNLGVLVLLAVAGSAIGWWQAERWATMISGYAAGYNVGIAFSFAVLFCIIGLILLIYWRTRWLGGGLIALGVLSYATFCFSAVVLSKQDRVAWRHERLRAFGPAQKASAVIYFQKGISDRQVEDYRSSVLEQGDRFPSFVSSYLRLSPSQANGNWAIALTFAENAPADKVDSYWVRIRTDPRVARVFANVAPDSLHTSASEPNSAPQK